MELNELFNAFDDLDEEYGTEFRYKWRNGKLYIYDANGIYSPTWANGGDDAIADRLNEAIAEDFGNDCYLEFENNESMYVKGAVDEDGESEDEDEEYTNTSLATKNEVAKTYNRNEVSVDNEYIENTRKVLEKLGRLAKAIANHFGWDAGIVMQDFVKDLQLINDPSLIAQLDSSNPIDMMTKDLMQMYLADQEAFNIFRNSAVNRIMNMSEAEAVRTLESILGRGRITTNGTNQLLSNRNQARIGNGNNNQNDSVKDNFYSENALEQLKTLKTKYGIDNGYKKETDEGWFEIVEKDKNNKTYSDIMFGVDEEAQIIDETKDYIMVFWRKYDKGHDPRDIGDNVQDSKSDDNAFIEKFGQEAFDRYNRIKQKLTSSEEKDITWITAHVDKKDLNDIFNKAEFGEYEPIAENEEYVVFNVDDLDMCKKLAKGTNWCITNPSAWNTNAKYGAKYYFFINKNTGAKYCVASVSGLYDIVDQNDNELPKLPNGVPSIGENIRSSVVAEESSNEDALLETALRNIDLLSVGTLRIAYDDLFDLELSELEDDEVKPFLKQKIQEMDTIDLKTYIEEHIDDFVAFPSEEDADDYLEEDVEFVDLNEGKEKREQIKEINIIADYFKNMLKNRKMITLKKEYKEDENILLEFDFTEEAYDLMRNETADVWYNKDVTISIFDENYNGKRSFEILMYLIDQEERIWIDEYTDLNSNADIKRMLNMMSDYKIKQMIKEQNSVYE